MMANPVCDIGLVGLAVMGQNLVLNMNDHGYKVAVFDRTTSKGDVIVQDQANGTAVVGSHCIAEMCGLLKRRRTVTLMVKAGEVVDQTIQLIAPHLQAGDVLIDHGNSLFTDSERWAKERVDKIISFIDTGVSRGAAGALCPPHKTRDLGTRQVSRRKSPAFCGTASGSNAAREFSKLYRRAS
jgi:6-phosphogluconate dehydrogenase